MVTDLINLSPYAAGSEKLHSLGYSTIPLPPGSKGPKLPNWVRFCYALPSSEDRRRFSRLTAAGIGICTGFPVGDDLQLIAIDIDVDGDAFDRISSALPFSPMVKVGAKGATLFFLADRRIRSRAYSDANGNRLLDLKAKGGQVAVPPTVHPDIGRPYVWLSDPVPLAELPVLALDHFTRLEEALELCGWSDAHAAVIGGDGELADVAGRELRYESDSVLGEMFVEANQRALRDLSLWVPRLGIYNCRRKSNGYEGVAHWRPSTIGRPLQERRRNLSITSMGIRDFGGIGYSPVALVAAALGVSRMDAMFVLRDWTGIQAEADEHYDRVLVPFIEKVRRLQQAKALTLSAPRTAVIDDDGTLHDPETGEVIGHAEEEPLRPQVRDSARELPDYLAHPEGALGRIADWIDGTARRPNRALSIAAAISVVGTLIGRRDATPTRSGTHMFNLVLGPTGVGKQHGINAITRLLKAAEAIQHLGTGDYMSTTALEQRLLNQPLTLSVADEFGKALSRFNGRRAGGWESGITATMRRAWGSSFEDMMTNEAFNRPSEAIPAPAYSIHGISTPEEVFDALNGSDVINGLLNRFLLITTEKRHPDQDPVLSSPEVPQKLADEVALLYRTRRQLEPLLVSTVEPYIVKWGDGARDIYCALTKYCEDEGDRNKALEPYLARTAEMAVRLATICAVGREPDWPEVSVADITWGRDLALWSAMRLAEDAGDFIADTPYAREQAKVVGVLRRANGEFVKFRAIMRATGIKKKDLDEHIDALVFMRRVERVHEQSARGGSPSILCRLMPNHS